MTFSPSRRRALLSLVAFLSAPVLFAGEPSPKTTVATQRVGDTTYFHVTIEAPPDLQLNPFPESAISTEAWRRWLARLPQLVSQDDQTTAVYPCLNLQRAPPPDRSLTTVPLGRPVVGLTWAVDGKVQAAGTEGNAVRLWGSRKGFAGSLLQSHTEPIGILAFSPDGTKVASGSQDQTVIVWDLATGKRCHQLRGHSQRVSTVAFAPDGRTVASGSLDRAVKLWDMVTGKELRALAAHGDAVRSVAWGPEGKMLVSGGDDRVVKLWDPLTGKLVRTFPGHRSWVWAVAMAPGGQTIASGSMDGTAILWKTTTGEALHRLHAKVGYVPCVAFSPDGKTLATGTTAGQVQFWEVATVRELEVLTGHTDEVLSVAFRPDGCRLVSGGADQAIKLWDVPGTSVQRVGQFRSEVLLGWDRERGTPVRELKFVGRCRASAPARLLLLYPTDCTPPAPPPGPAPSAPARNTSGWTALPIALDLTQAAPVTPPERLPTNPWEAPAGVALDTIWALAQARHFDALAVQAPQVGFYVLAREATVRKYGLKAEPLLPRVSAPNPLVDPGYGQLYELSTGATALTESLALGRVLAPRSSLPSERTINIAQVRGIEVATHPWEKMLAGKQVIDPLAKLVPHDNYYVHFRNLNAALQEVGNVVDRWGGNLLALYEVSGRDYQLRKRYEQQLCLDGAALARALDANLVRGVALTGSDLYLREGSDISVLFHVTDRPRFLQQWEPLLQAARAANGADWKERQTKYHGVTIESFTTPLREVSLYRAAVDDFVLCANSPLALQRLLDTQAGRSKSLADALDFRYMRSDIP